MESDESSAVVKPGITKKGTGYLRAKETSTPSYKKTASIHKGVFGVVRKKTRGGDSYTSLLDTQEDTSSDGNGKEIISASTGSDRVIPLSNDEFKDF